MNLSLSKVFRGLSLLGFVAVLFVLVPSAAAQYVAFGKNKVHYSDFDWRVLESDHFDLYYYAEEEELAGLALKMAEEAYDDLQGKFRHDVTRRIPLIIYNSFQDFEQNNITPFFLPEGVAGLTEFARGRVLVPFNGSLFDFRTTIHHELVHVYQLSMVNQVYKENFRTPFLTPPLWFTEGLAVHFTETRDPEADMVLRDLVLAGNLPEIDEFWRYAGSFVTYKLGQSVLDYIGENFGEDRIPEIYRRLWRFERFNEVLEDVLGIPTRELSERWSFSLKSRYFPNVTAAEPASFSAQTLTMSGGANMKPTPLPGGLAGFEDRYLFVSPRDGFTNVYTARLGGPERDVEVLIKGERTPEFESLHLFQSRFDVSDEGLLLLVSKHQDRDEVVVYDIVKRDVMDRFGFDDLVALQSPSWSSDGRRFVFSGLSRDGFSDLYLYDLDSRSLRRLTFDRFEDVDPAFCPWEDRVAFSSDRTPSGGDGARNIFTLELGTGEVSHVTRGAWVDQMPAWDDSLRALYFVSNRDRFQAVYRVDSAGRGHKLTESLDAVFDPRPIPGTGRFLATVFKRGQFQVHEFAAPEELGEEVTLGVGDGTPYWHWDSAAPDVSSRRAEYRSRFSLDIAQGGVLVDPSLQTGEGVQAALSDMMGNHLLFLNLANTTFSTSDFLANFSAGVTYVNLSQRLNYGLSVFHYSGDFFDTLDFPFEETRSGASVLLSYPMSKFQRVETSVSLAYAETDRASIDFQRKGAMGTHSVSFVHDNTLWLPSGPIDGSRFNVTAGLRMNLKKGAAENTILLGDYRRYLRMGQRSAYAVRLQGRLSEGDNPEFYWIGGSLNLRTYDRRAITGNRTLMLNQEIRFPLIRGLILGLPMGNIELPGVQGAFFLDAGSAWAEGWPPPEWYGVYGFGMRMGFGGFLVLRLDMGRRTDFEKFGDTTHSRFFIGWNY